MINNRGFLYCNTFWEFKYSHQSLHSKENYSTAVQEYFANSGACANTLY